MRHGAAQIFKADFLAGNGFNDFRAGDEHVAGVFHHKNPVCHGGRIHGASGCGSHDGRYLGDNAGRQGIAVKNLTETRQRIHAFLNSGAAGIVHADKRHAGFHGHVHDLADFFGVHLSEAAAAGCKILRKRKHGAAIHQAMPCDDAVAGNINFFHTEIGAPV